MSTTDPSTDDELAHCAAEAALLVAWCAVMEDSEIVRPAAYVVTIAPATMTTEIGAGPLEAQATIEALVRVPKPVLLTAQSNGTRARVTVTREVPPSPDSRATRLAHDRAIKCSAALAQMAEHMLGAAMPGTVLLVGGLERLRIPAAALRVLARDYRLDVPMCASGSPLAEWGSRGYLDLDAFTDVGVVLLLGRSTANGCRRLIAFDPPLDVSSQLGPARGAV